MAHLGRHRRWTAGHSFAKLLIRYPAGIGGKHFGRQFLVGGSGNRFLGAPPDLGKGHTYRLVLQIFPDGRAVG